MGKIVYQHRDGLPPAKSIALTTPPGFLSSGEVVLGHNPTGGHIRIVATIDGIIESKDLDELSLAELNSAVELLGVDTSAQTASGLKRAIERHFE